MVTVLLSRNLAGLLHSTGAKKPNETNKTVVLAASNLRMLCICTYINVVSFHLFYVYTVELCKCAGIESNYVSQLYENYVYTHT